MREHRGEVQALTAGLAVERRVAETERARLATLIGTMPDAVLVLDSAGRAVYRNDAYVRFEESVTLEDAEGRDVPSGVADLRARVSRGEEFAVELRATTPQGRRRWFEAYGRPVPADVGIGDGGILVVHDTSDIGLRRLQEEFVGIVAHELRTPLTALRGYLQMLNKDAGGTAVERLAPLALAQAERLDRLVGELFDATRAQTGRLRIDRRPVSLDQLVDDTVEIAQSLNGDQVVRVEHGVRDLVVEADPGRIQQVLLNLLANAAVHAGVSPEVVVRTRRRRQWAEIEVEDHGPGIARAKRERLFSRYQQGDPQSPSGLGLGLYVSRAIARAHKGTIEVDSAAGKGTTFKVRLPLRAPGVKAARARKRATARPAK